MPVCATKYCRRTSKGKHCYRCEHDRKKKSNPYGYWLGVLRRNARRRGVFFGLTFGYWVTWCDDTGYLAMKGKGKHSASVDRIINELGYVDGNIQLLPLGINSTKGNKNINWNYVTQEWEIQPGPVIENKTDLPF